MICILGKLPILKVGDYQVTGYSTQWIRTAIEQAAQRAQHDEFAFTDDVYEGVLHYLEHKCSLRMLPLEDLYKRLAHMLSRIGYASIAQALAPIAPPITVSLEQAAKTAGDGFELAFFHALQQELQTLKSSGAENIYFSHIKECVQILRQTTDWNADCDTLEAEILSWLDKAGTQPQRQGYRIRATLKQLT